MNHQQEIALTHHCRLAFETATPKFCYIVGRRYSVVLTVNSGYE